MVNSVERKLRLGVLFLIAPSNVTTQSVFKPLGCWKDTRSRAIPTLEGKDARLKGRATSRDYSIDLCYQSAKARGYHIFAVQNGGCFGMTGTTRYQKYGKVTTCKYGKGGSWSNDVYQIGGKLLLASHSGLIKNHAFNHYQKLTFFDHCV